jgi:hypothetical protein
LGDANAILPVKRVTKQIIRCAFHHKESRYEIAHIESEHLVTVTCLECPKGQELLRFKVAKEW